MWGSPLGEMVVNQLVYTCSRCSSLKGGNSRSAPSNSVNARFGITYQFRSTRKWNIDIIHVGGKIGVTFFVFMSSKSINNNIVKEKEKEIVLRDKSLYSTHGL